MSAACFLSHMELRFRLIHLSTLDCVHVTQIKLGGLLQREVEIHREGRDAEQCR